MSFDPSISNASATTASTQVPAIRTFQMDSSSQGNLASSVNLFRGDVNLSQTLFTLPGRSQGSGLDVSVTIQYQSNVFNDATTWNADAPTGILGLGWSFPLTYIEAADGMSPVASTRQYILHDNGSSNQLFQQPILPLVFSMSATLAKQLQNGKAISTEIRDAFLSCGLLVDATASIVGVGPWTVQDNVNQQTFTLKSEANTLNVYDGGELYQLQNYQFWKILYYPQYERWLIVSDKGVRRSFGGQTVSTNKGFATSRGNSIAWSVWWSDQQQPVWTGASDRITDQVQVARAWYLSEVADRFGSTTQYVYNNWSRNSSGIIPGVEQQVGNGGKPYTKAVYLSQIQDIFGRIVYFAYGNKLWNSASESPREYHDPHRTMPSNEPGPYQDRYETCYLEHIDVKAASGSLMFSIDFQYNPSPSATGADSAVANVTSNIGNLKGNTYKRFLTGIIQRNQDGVAQPGLRFVYDLAMGTSGGQPGALLAVTYPSGGVARYTYAEQNLSIAERTLTADRPSGVPEGGTPRVFFGNNYAVVTYYQENSLQLSMQVYTWTGTWLSWQLTNSAVIDTQGIDLTTLEVLAQSDFLALTFQRTNRDRAVYVFQRDTARPGQWQAGTIHGVTTAPNQPTLTYTGSNNKVSFSGGSTFFVIGQMNPGTLKGSYQVVTWRWTTQAWTIDTVQTSYAWLIATNEYYAVLDRSGQFSLHYLDGSLNWQAIATMAISGLSTVDLNGIQLVPGDGLITVANLTSSNFQQNNYKLWIVEWDAQYTTSVSSFGPYIDYFGSNNAPLSWTPQILSDALIAVNGNILRRTGFTWLENTDLNLGGNPPRSTTQRYAYGTDFAIQVVVPTSGVGSATARIVAYDPTQSAPWKKPTSLGQALPTTTTLNQNWPSVSSDDWVVVGPYVYYRGTATDWGTVLAESPVANLNEIVGQATLNSTTYNSESLVNQSPTFMAYTVEQDNHSLVQSLILKNGNIDGAPSAFAHEKLYVASESSGVGAGLSPRGPSLFATYPSSFPNLNAAQSILLHRYAGLAVEGPITHYTVIQVEMDDGFGDPIPTAFDPDVATAGSDPSGTIVKFFQNTVYPGVTCPDNAIYGRVVNRYLNGLQDQTGDNYYDMLDGLLIETQTYGQGETSPLQSTTTTYSVLEQIASSPTDSSVSAIQLRGGWVTKTRQILLNNGVTTTTATSYTPPGQTLPYSGGSVTKVQSQYSGAGDQEFFTKTTTYGVQIDPRLVAIHALTDIAQVQTVWANNQGSAALSATANTYKSWPSAVGSGVLIPSLEASFAMVGTNEQAFPYATYCPGSTPAGWQVSARTTARTIYGQESENVDAMGVPTTTIFDTRNEIAVARIGNTKLTGCAYLGFQPYESTQGWTLTNVVFDEQDTYTGIRSAVLPQKANALVAVSVIPRMLETYLIGCRYRTPTGFQTNASGLTVTVTADGSPQPPVSLPWQDTKDTWTYVTLPVTISTGSKISLAVSLTNDTASDIHVDGILVVPRVNGSTLRTFDQDSQQILSTMDASGRTSRMFYDRSYQPTISVGASGLVRELALRFRSRQGNVHDQFDDTSPNTEITLHPAAGGILETFRDGGGWTKRWRASDYSNWEVSDGSLVHQGTSPGTICWQGDPGDQTYALYFELATTMTSQVNVTVGDIIIGWASGAYIGRQDKKNWKALGSPPTIARHWLVVVGQGVILFFADGQLLFSEKVTPSSKALEITTKAATSTFRHLMVLQQIRLGLSYNDATARQRQIHQLHHADSYLCELVYDALDRKIATTKNVPGSFGSGAQFPVLLYRSEFLDVKTFLAATQSTWIMTGDVADYYMGQSNNGVPRSNDAGYPYWGKRYEASPRNLQVEIGQPGKPYAIDLTVHASRRQTVQLTYQSNSCTNSNLPDGQYHETRMMSAVKTVSSRVTDQLGQLVFKTVADAEGNTLNQSSGSRSYAAPSTGPTIALHQQLPNALVAGPQSGDPDYVKHTVTNALQEPASLSDPDTGQTQFIFDSTGNLRFVQPAIDAEQHWFVYYKYDAIGRLIEEGTVEEVWEPVQLRAQADNAAYPTKSISVAVTTEYDGDGTDPTTIGMKYRTTAYNPSPTIANQAGDCIVVETFGYDTAGHITSVAQTISGPVNATGTISYTYNAIGEVLQATLPTGAPIESVFYGYNDQGNVCTVGTTENGSDLGAFTYTAEGQIATQVYGNGAWKCLVEYTSPGWTQALTTTSAASNDGVGFKMSYEPDGNLKTRQVHLSSNSGSSYIDHFTYDGQRRLSAMSGSADVDYSQYDADGNLWKVAQGDSISQFTSGLGTNRLATVSLDGGVSQPITYDAQGRMKTGLGRSLAYDNATGMTTSISNGSNHIRLAYGGAQQRVLKQILTGDGQERVYFSGAGQVPVATLVNGKWTVQVHGPTGLLAYVSDQTYFPIKDITGSVWAVVTAADSGLQGTLTYLPFGSVSGTSGNNDIIPYRYQGQEWDAEVGLYNFRMRMYDPVLRRFLAPDPRRQFSSSYVFAGNNPLIITDPTGEISIWAQVGIGTAMVAIAAIGIGLTLFTGGASDAAAAGAEGGLAGALAGTEGAAIAGGEAGAAGAEAGAAGAGAAASGEAGATAGATTAETGAVTGATTGAGAEGTTTAGATGSAEVGAGATTGEAAGSSFSWTTYGVNTLGSTLSSTGTSGLQYDIQHGRDFTAKGFFEAAGIGAASGFASGALGGALNPLTDALTEGGSGISGALRTATGRAIAGAIKGAISSDLKVVLTNVSQHQPWYQGLLKSTLTGAASSAATGALGSLGKSTWAAREAIAAKGVSKNLISDATVTKINTLPEIAKSAATSDVAISSYIVAGFFLPSGYVVWGAATNFGHH
ncbi:MAG: RHS repeat-associated core domain-containing protein [Cyanobacteria bacterium P01_H01_bin.26]